MVYKFSIISEEVDSFRRDIQIDPDATFYELHQAILDSVNFTEDLNSSFQLCDDYWDIEKEVTLEDLNSRAEDDSWLMKEVELSELLDEEGQKLVYLFDAENERGFHMELSEIITGVKIKKPNCTKKVGKAPEQYLVEETVVQNTPNLDLDDSFYGDQEFNIEDFDPEGFDELDDNSQEEKE